LTNGVTVTSLSASLQHRTSVARDYYHIKPKLSHTSRASAHNTPKPKPLSILPINTSRIISYNTLTMTFVTTLNCKTVDNIYVKNM